MERPVDDDLFRGEELVRAAYGTNYARLVEIKQKCDPRSVLRRNQNIKPDQGRRMIMIETHFAADAFRVARVLSGFETGI